MTIKLMTAHCSGGESELIQVECSILSGFTGIQLLGQVDESCRNGIERAKGALEFLDEPMPKKKLIINLSPAEIKKEGSHYDLAFALAIRFAGEEDFDIHIKLQSWLIVGEISLDGSILPVKNIISYGVLAKRLGLAGMIVPSPNLLELETLNLIDTKQETPFKILGFHNLKNILAWAIDHQDNAIAGQITEKSTNSSKEKHYRPPCNFDDMVLDEQQKELALIVATGLHSLLLYGPPGTGKSMFCQRLVSILPKMDIKTHIEALKVYSSYKSGIPRHLLAGCPPYRSPHHQTSSAAILGTPDGPGEASLAHGGVLFLDEFPEFRRDIIESLREPLETGHIRVSRAKHKLTWPSRSTLIAACNLCPCGWLSSQKKKCICPTQKILAYRRRVSGPIIDRIDLHFNMKENVHNHSELFLNFEKTSKQTQGKTSELLSRVEAAREFALKRNTQYGITYNRYLQSEHIKDCSKLSSESFAELINRTIPKKASFRSILRTMRVARTVADLDQRETLEARDIEKAWSLQSESAAKARGDAALGLC